MFKVIKNSGISENEVRLVQTDINYDRKDKLFDNAKAGLVKYFGRAMDKDKVEKVDKAFALNEGDQEAFYGGWRDRSGTFPNGKSVTVVLPESVLLVLSVRCHRCCVES